MLGLNNCKNACKLLCIRQKKIREKLQSYNNFPLFRIFSPKGIELDEDQPSPSPSDLEDSHPNKLNRGVLRSKIEAGEGTIPSANLYQGM